jgi:hypothetical protein
MFAPTATVTFINHLNLRDIVPGSERHAADDREHMGSEVRVSSWQSAANDWPRIRMRTELGCSDGAELLADLQKSPAQGNKQSYFLKKMGLNGRTVTPLTSASGRAIVLRDFEYHIGC